MSHRLKKLIALMAFCYASLFYLVPQGVALGQDQGPVQIVIEALASDDPAMRTGAIALVRDIPGPEVTKALAKELPNLPVASQVQLLSALADRSDSAALPAVVDAAKAADESVRVAALKALGQLGDASTVSLLAHRAGQTRGQEQIAARESLYRLRGPEVDQAILREISSAEPKVKIELVQSIGQRNIVSGVPSLLKTAQDADSKVQRESFKVLKNVADEKHLPALVELLMKVKSTSVRSEAEKTVAAVAHKIERTDRQAEAVLAALPSADDADTRCSLLNVLGKIGDDSALGVLRAALDDNDPKVKSVAIRALSDWPNAKPVDDLFKVASHAGKQQHQILALRGYVRLIGLPSNRPAHETIGMYKQVMRLAPSKYEKMKVLSGLANTKSLAALEMAAGYLQHDDLRSEAQVAVVKIAEGVYGSYPRQTKEVLQKLMQASISDATRQSARQIINRIDRFEDYITAWHVSGPYTKTGVDGSGLFDVAFGPEKPNAADIVWRITPAGTNEDRPWLMELDKVLGGDNRVAYLRTEVWSDRTRKARLEIGSDDGIKVWLNGHIVHANNAIRPVSPGQDKFEVTLKQGWSRLLLKVTQGGGQWAVCARFRELDGTKIEGLKVQAEE